MWVAFMSVGSRIEDREMKEKVSVCVLVLCVEISFFFIISRKPDRSFLCMAIRALTRSQKLQLFCAMKINGE